MVLVKGLGLIVLQETSFWKQVKISDDVMDRCSIFKHSYTHSLLASNNRETQTQYTTKCRHFSMVASHNKKYFFLFKSHVFQIHASAKKPHVAFYRGNYKTLRTFWKKNKIICCHSSILRFIKYWQRVIFLCKPRWLLSLHPHCLSWCPSLILWLTFSAPL